MVKIYLNNLNSKIVGYLSDDIHIQLDKVLSYRVQGARFSPQFKAKKWDGIIHLYNRNQGQSFYSGLLSYVCQILDDNKIPFQRIDERVRPIQNLPHLIFSPPEKYEERDYQQFTIQRSLKRSRGILKVATGGGKTMIVSQMIAGIKTAPFMFYVLTIDLLKQAYEELSRTLNEPIGVIGGGQCDIKNINVCTIQTAIRALHLGEKIKISDYKFDEDDVWEEEELISVENLKKLRNLIYSLKGIYVDECISGDTEIVTELGKIRIDDAMKNKCRFVQTYDGNNIVFKPILNWWDKGIQKTLDINLSNGEKITCTKNHLFFTKRGWIEAQSLQKTDLLLYADADAVEKLKLPTNIGHKNLYLDTRSKKEQKKNGLKYTQSISNNFHSAYADVAKKSYQDIKQLTNLLNPMVRNADMQNISKDMTNNQYIQNTILSHYSKRNRRLSEHLLETLPLFCQTKDQKITDCVQTMDYVKKNGQITKKIFCTDMECNPELQTMEDLEIKSSNHGQLVCHALPKSQNFYIRARKNKFQKKSLTQLDLSDLHGGYAMMDQTALDIYHYTQKDGQKKRTELSKIGSIQKDTNAEHKEQKRMENSYTTFDLIQMDRRKSLNASKDMSQNACHTNWLAIKSIKKNIKPIRVYDIEVKDTHCFFANNILVHNCHHAAAKTVKEALSASPHAFWRFGGSATPFREDGAEIVIQAMFGQKIVDISASYLIERGHLAEPYIIFEPIVQNCKFHAYPSIYKQCVIDNKDFNNHVADTANYLVSKGQSVLVLVTRYAQGDYLKTLIPDTEFVTGRMTNKKREEAIEDLRTKKKKCMIATTLADEGLDIPTLDAVLMAGGGASATRVNQRIGRALRKDKKSATPKTKALAIYYDHKGVKHLGDHAKRVKKILKIEPRFHVLDSSGPDFIFSEIDEAMGWNTPPKSDTPTLFNL